MKNKKEKTTNDDDGFFYGILSLLNGFRLGPPQVVYIIMFRFHGFYYKSDFSVFPYQNLAHYLLFFYFFVYSLILFSGLIRHVISETDTNLTYQLNSIECESNHTKHMACKKIFNTFDTKIRLLPRQSSRHTCLHIWFITKRTKIAQYTSPQGKINSFP